MRTKWLPLRTLWTIVVGLAAASTSQAALGRGPCEQITTACQGAGFVQGGARGGNGIRVDCIDPIMQGTAQPHKASKPLPYVDPQLVAACKAKNPSFGQSKALPSGAGDQPLPMSPPPVAAVQSAPSQAFSTPTGRPNIVFVLTDDLSWNLVQYMPHVLKMQQEGVTFANYFVTDSLCCPSRSSIFTGRYPHDTGVFRNTGADGGYLAFLNRGHEQATFAVALSAAGYRTAMYGKYLNGYLPQAHHPAPGWTSWAVAGNGYPEFNYDINQEGSVFRYGKKPTDYLTDVLSGLGVRFISQAGGAPFFIELATFAPHAPYTPAPRDAEALPGLRAPRTPAFDAAPDAKAVKWLVSHPPLSDADMAAIDRDFRKRTQSVLAVDKMIGELQAAVAAIGQAQNTYFIFSSDNGYHMGEHRLMPGKMTAYDTDIHVPLIITGPGVPAGRTVEEITENTDLYSTFTELGGAAAPAAVDGRSLVPLLHGQEVPEWRTVALVEHHGPLRDRKDPDAPGVRSGNPTTYEAIRTRTSVYVEYADGEKEYHDRVADPDELRNTFSSLPSEEKASLHAALEAIANCHDAKSCWAAGRASRSVARGDEAGSWPGPQIDVSRNTSRRTRFPMKSIILFSAALALAPLAFAADGQSAPPVLPAPLPGRVANVEGVSQQVKIMPLGDSITFGSPDRSYGDYRHLLGPLLANDGYSIDFVGSRESGNGVIPHPENEGHPGWTILQIQNGIDSDGWLETYHPDIILLHVGTNDIRQGNAAAAVGNLSALLGDILARLPQTHVLVAQIIPFRRGPDQDHQSYNAAIPGIVASKGRRVLMVDMQTILSSGDYADGLHPNAGGYDKMARAWGPAIRTVLSSPTQHAIAQSPPSTSAGEGVKPGVPAAPPGTATGPALRFVPGSTIKLEQLLGEEDKERHQPTRSRTVTRYGIQGTDLGYSFEHEGHAYFLFGDTMGRLGRALDTIATTDAPDPEQGVRLDFLTVDREYLTIQPPGIRMGAFEVPVSGIDLGGQMYVVVSTNHSMDRTTDRSVLTKFTPPATFQPLRTISQLPAGRFVKMSLHTEPGPMVGLPPGGPFVIIWGTGAYRRSDAYLSIVPAAHFETGEGTRYFAGLDAAGKPTWSARESEATPIVENGTMGDMSVTWCKDLDLWLMTYDSRPPAPRGILFSYSRTPWGPWSEPQILFNAVRDGALGTFIHNPRAEPDDGLAGPVIGKGQANAGAVRGGAYAPYVIERWTKLQGSELNLYYVLSTWNPYVVVLMKSRLRVE